MRCHDQSMNATGPIQEIVDRETHAWDTQNVPLLLSVFHPDMVWAWPATYTSLDPVDWRLAIGRFDAKRWGHLYSELFRTHTLIHNRRATIKTELSAEGDGGMAIVDIDTLWQNNGDRPGRSLARPHLQALRTRRRRVEDDLTNRRPAVLTPPPQPCEVADTRSSPWPGLRRHERPNCRRLYWQREKARPPSPEQTVSASISPWRRFPTRVARPARRQPIIDERRPAISKEGRGRLEGLFAGELAWSMVAGWTLS